jgi:hypothetical protein
MIQYSYSESVNSDAESYHLDAVDRARAEAQVGTNYSSGCRGYRR